MVDRSQSPLPRDDGAFVIRPLIPLDRYLAFGARLTLIILAIAGVYWMLATDKLAVVGVVSLASAVAHGSIERDRVTLGTCSGKD